MMIETNKDCIHDLLAKLLRRTSQRAAPLSPCLMAAASILAALLNPELGLRDFLEDGRETALALGETEMANLFQQLLDDTKVEPTTAVA